MSDAEGFWKPVAAPRHAGLWLVTALVVVGMGIGAAYYKWKAPPLIRELRAMKAALPEKGPERLEAWMMFGAPMIHNRLQYLRLSAQQPWLVTHLVEHPGEPPAVWGVDFSGLPVGITTRTDMTVTVRLPAARELARTELVGDNARLVPRYRAGEIIPDPDARAEEMVLYALRHPDDFIARMQKDIEGATLTVAVGDAP